MIGFDRKRSLNELYDLGMIGLQGVLDAREQERVNKIRTYWNFYEGYHWEEIPDQESPEITLNYCRTFVDKYVAFELGKSFTLEVKGDTEEDIKVSSDFTKFQYLDNVWEDNKKDQLINEIGQMKSITGEAWIQVKYFDVNELEEIGGDPFNIYDKGKIELLLIPSGVVFAEYNQHQKTVLEKLTIMYTYEKVEKTPILGTLTKKQVVYKQVWTKDQVAVEDDGVQNDPIPNKYGTIPFIQIKNLPIAGRTEGKSDLEDIIPANVEFNQKESNVSEILDYHASPITVVYGARIGNLEKGANKVWGGLAKDSRIENLQLQGDLGASSNYINGLKQAMCEIGSVPANVLGGSQAISNTSGVALQYMNLPLVEKTRLKRTFTKEGIIQINKYILLISLLEGIISKPESVSNRDFYYNDVNIPDTLPKDKLLELQQIQLELQAGLESRKNAMKRLGKENIDSLIEEIDEEKLKNQEMFTKSLEDKDPKLNSGMTNGETIEEVTNAEKNGFNKKEDI